MKLKKYKQLYVFLGLVFFTSFLLVYLITSVFQGLDLKRQKSTQAKAEANNLIAEVEVFKNYLLCNHVVKENEFPLRIDDANMALLSKQYPVKQGWKINVEKSNKINITQDLKKLCPEDEEKRYLAVHNNYLAIYKGPMGYGTLEKITEIKVTTLPKEWQEKAYRGELVFANEAELLEALDSLDEYE
ncbi:hypothetical protein RDV78_05755 [Bacillota bacterium LX-D]|nr:hypothetical protein [Bacillota bacterium LX-D]